MPEHKKPNKDLMRYAGMGTQILVSLGVAVYLGYLVDSKWLKFAIPLATIVFPLVVLFAMIYTLIRQTSKKTTDDSTKQV